MRIALVVSGGVDRSGREHVIPVLVSLVDRLARRHEVTVYVLQYHARPCTYRLAGATVHDLGRPRGLARRLLALVSALRRDGPFDVIHAYWAAPAGVVSTVAGRLRRTPVVVTMNSGELAALPEISYGLLRSRRTRFVLEAVRRLATRTVVCTNQAAERARHRGWTPVVIPIGVDTAIFVPGPIDAGPPYRLLHVADLNPVKDQRTLLRAFRSIVDAVGAVHLDVIGRDTLGGAVQRYATELQIDQHVTFHGFLPSDRILPFYQRAHILVVSSLHEGGSIVAIEAAASGVPVVGTAVGHVADWAPEAAAAVPVGDAAALANAVISLLGDAGCRAALATAARQWAVDHNIDYTVGCFERLYAAIVRPKPSGDSAG